MYNNIVTEMILAIFRLNGLLLAHGDRLAAPFGLTSARWQILGVLCNRSRPATIADIALQMGLTRQAVQRIVKEMEKQEMVSIHPNPRHKRAYWLQASAKGVETYRRVMEVQRPWSEILGAKALEGGHKVEDLKQSLHLLKRMISHLEGEQKNADT